MVMKPATPDVPATKVTRADMIVNAIGALVVVALTTVFAALFGFYCHLVVRAFQIGWGWVS